jgi:catechol 2,3-dioxygenase-like lactoylglutathione lyase family enzyme
MDWKIQVIPLPVSDVDRAKEFYTEQLGFTLDVDHRAGDDFRVVQLTPPGSNCSIMVGIGITDGTPGSVKGVHIVVADIEAAHAELTERGVEISPLRHMSPNGWVDGVDPQHTDFNSFADFADPDGNSFVLQERGHDHDA